MRVTDLNRYNAIAAGLSQAAGRMLTLQEEISSGKKVNKPSDDPVGMAQILGYRSDLSAISQYGKNMNQGNAFLSTTESALNDMENLLSSAKQIAVAQSSATATATSRSTAAAQVQNLYSQALAIANTKLGDQYVFAGFKTSTAPFDSSGNYQGDSNAIFIQMDQTSQLQINVPGDQAFKGAADLFAALNGLQQALTNNDTGGIQNAITTISNASDQVLNSQTEVGTRQDRIQQAQSNFSQEQVDLTQADSNVEDLDMAKAATDLASSQNAYQASLLAASNIMQTSLVNYLG